jgi:lipoprotein-releasing system permease protein
MENWIDRQKNILGFTLSSLLRRKGKNSALLFVYTLIVFVLASIVFFTQAIKKEATTILKDAPEVIIQKSVAGRHDLIPIQYIEKVKAIKGVSAVRARL